MPRKIPWLATSPAKPKEAASSSDRPKAPRPAKRQRVVTPEFDEDEENEFIAAGAFNTRQRKERSERALSSSPIYSSSEGGPPATRYMKEGIGDDDDWMMVEDEFLATATLFTKHLHHAEYMRVRKLQKEAESSDKSTTPNGELSAGIKNRKASGYDGADFQDQSSFRGLTKGPPPSAALPASKKPGKPGPRREYSLPPRRMVPMTPSAAYSNQSILAGLAKELDGISCSDDSDDLDAPARLRQQTKPPTSRAPKVFGLTNKSTSLALSPPKRPPDPLLSTSRKSLSTTISKPAPSTRLSTTDSLDDDFSSHQKPSGSAVAQASGRSTDSISRVAKRREERVKKQEEGKRKSLLLEEIPTFLV